jgi:ABC-type transport system involved in multi-copper enzyme maturation permease subunit
MLGGNLVLLGLAATWMTPLWLLSVGVTVFLIGLAALFGLLKMLAPKGAAALELGIREGMLLPVMYLLGLTALFSLVALTVVPFRPLLLSVWRIPSVGGHDRDVTITAAKHGQLIPIDFRPVELQSFELTSDQPLTVVTHVVKGAGNDGTIKLSADHPVRWAKSGIMDKAYEPTVQVTDWSVDNLTAKPATLHIHTVTDIEYPEVRVVPWVTVYVAGLFLVYFLLRQLAPKVSAIALTTSKEVMSQPLFYIVAALGSVLLVAFIIIPYNTLGEDIKMLKDSGLTLVMVFAILVSVWSASVSLADEIEGRTALTVLSKPIGRRQFILGKFMGIIEPALLLFILLGFVFMVCISYKVVYDAREMAQTEPTWQACYIEVVRIVPGLVLAFFETVVLAAISVALSTRLPMLANLVVCIAIYVLGHLVPLLVASSVGHFEIVHFVGMFLATVLPVLDTFNIQAAVAGGVDVPSNYLGLAGLYCLLYCTMAMLGALAMFEDRDLA